VLFDNERSPVSLAEEATFGMPFEFQLVNPILRVGHVVAYGIG
jgi:hypothetical protein